MENRCKKKVFCILTKCDANINHNLFTYEEFVNLYSKKDYDNIDFKQKYIQKILC